MKIKYVDNDKNYIIKEEQRLSYHEIIDSSSRAGLILDCYEGGQRVFWVTQNSWATSGSLEVNLNWDNSFEEFQRMSTQYQYNFRCVDPRIVMMHILTGRLMLMAAWAGYDDKEVEKEINSVLPSPSVADAREWLERNRFIGKNAVSQTDPNYRRKWGDNPGWNIGDRERDFVYLTPEIQELYDKYKRLWKEREARSDDEKGEY